MGTTNPAFARPVVAATLLAAAAVRAEPPAETAADQLTEPPIEAGPAPTYAGAGDEPSAKQRLIDALPDAIGDGLELDAWGWFSYAQAIQPDNEHYWDAELSLAFTKSFDQRFVVSAQVNFIDANDTKYVQFASGYLSALLSEDHGTILTVGKFNAGFGVEGRDFWNRRTGTVSLLFPAQPQDIIGAMLTQPVGDSGFKLRPFVTADFQGGQDMNQPQSYGLRADYAPSDDLLIKVTNMVGPGYVIWGGEDITAPYPPNAYGTDTATAFGLWPGPNLVAERRGTQYFLDASAEWRPTADLTLSAEYLLATTGTKGRRFGWQGWLLMAVYELNDRAHVYGRWSFLDDGDWFVTGFFQRRQEISVGGGWHVLEGVEVRAEYRHESSDSTPNADIASVHLTFTY